MKRFLATAVVAVAALTVEAQVGRVVDSKTKEPLVGVAVILEGTTSGATTDPDGIFALSHAQTGDTLAVSYLGYQPQHVAITGADTLYIYLKEDTQSLDEVTTVGHTMKNSDVALLRAERAALGMQTGISAQQIDRTQDKDAAEIIRRVPGISLIDDKFVMVRGLSQRYNQVWINGAAVPSSEADSRAFSFDLLPASQLDNLMIVKSPMPEYPADYSGGMVLVQTKEVPLRRKWQVSAGIGANDHTHFQDFYRARRSPTDWLGFSSTMRDFRGIETDWSVFHRKPIFDFNLGFSGSERWDLQHGQVLALLASFNYSSAYKTIRNMQNCLFGTYDKENDRSVYLRRSTDQQYTLNTRLGGLLNLTYQTRGGQDQLEFKNIFNQLGKERYTTRTGISAQSDNEQSAEYNYQSRTTYSGQFTGHHSWTLDEGCVPAWKFDWSAGYAYSDRNQPDRKRYLVNDALETGVMALSAGNDISREYTYLQEHIASLGANWSVDFRHDWFRPTLKTGLYAEYRSREYTTHTYYYGWNPSTCTLPAGFRQWDIPTELMQTDNYGDDKLYLQEEMKWRNNYRGKNLLAAGYVGLNLPFGPVNIYGGVRYEYNRMRLYRNLRDRERSETYTDYPASDFFPTANITWKISDQHQLRASYGRSVNRPEFRELSPSVYYDFDLASNVQGNVDLQSCYVHNADLRYEFYPKGDKGEIVSVALFYKHFSHPIEWTYTVTGGTDLTYSYQNALSAYSYGAEIDIRKDLSFIGAKGLSLSLNAAYIRSRVQFEEGSLSKDRPMQGQSPYLVNAGLFYHHDKTGWGCAVMYNRIGKRLMGIGRSVGQSGSQEVANIPDSYEMPRDVLDLSLSKQFKHGLELKIAARDVIGEKYVCQQIGEVETTDGTREVHEITRSFRPGRNFSITLSWKLE